MMSFVLWSAVVGGDNSIQICVSYSNIFNIYALPVNSIHSIDAFISFENIISND